MREERDRALHDLTFLKEAYSGLLAEQPPPEEPLVEPAFVPAWHMSFSGESL